MACRGTVGGYPCGGPGEPCPGTYYRPNNDVTRGQLAKIIANTAQYSETPAAQTFEDVGPGSTFYPWIKEIAGRGIVNGYPCGGPFEPCVPPTNRPYFRPNNNATRGQIAKIVAEARGYADPATTQSFEDVPPGNPFYPYIERLFSRGMIGGYPCGGPFEPCVGPGNRPYFRPNNPATRGQLAKIVTLAYVGP
jgi:ribosomal protein L30/L7E